jgi:hypothetical protein
MPRTEKSPPIRAVLFYLTVGSVLSSPIYPCAVLPCLPPAFPHLSTDCTVKKVPVHFPAPSRDVADQTLSSREHVSLLKPGDFQGIPFRSPEFSQNPFEPAGNSSKIFDNSFVYLFPAWNFPPAPDRNSN